jgi:hypothetical protein
MSLPSSSRRQYWTARRESRTSRRPVDRGVAVGRHDAVVVRDVGEREQHGKVEPSAFEWRQT